MQLSDPRTELDKAESQCKECLLLTLACVGVRQHVTILLPHPRENVGREAEQVVDKFVGAALAVDGCVLAPWTRVEGVGHGPWLLFDWP